MNNTKGNRFCKKDVLILAAMLATLHISIWIDFGSPVSKSIMLSHFGMFTIWQPIWRGDEKLSFGNALLFFIFALAFIYWLNYWLLFTWLIMLIGFIGGRVAFDRNERISLLLALSFLILQLLFGCMPEIARINITGPEWFALILAVVPFFMLFFPFSNQQNKSPEVDFIHAITTAMLVGLVALGSVLTMFLNESTYFVALTQTTLVIGISILSISWLSTSHSRFGGITQIWSSYMLNIGTPFEQWLNELARLNEKELGPEEFLQEAMATMASFNWITGVSWHVNDSEHETGKKTDYRVPVETKHFTACIYTYNRAGAALKLHCSLLARLLDNFYTNKLRETELTKQAHLMAIYETGARIAHDIKNILQGFHAITSIITNENSSNNSGAAQQVLSRQLPNLARRLQLALDKLQSPEILNKEEACLKDWWQGLQERNRLIGVSYQSDIHGNPMIPVDLFDSVIDNLLENANSKIISDTSIKVNLSLVCNNDLLSLTVCDTGAMIQSDITLNLLKNPVKSDNGLGIGLFQAAKHARMFGYKLHLLHNLPGRVCFELCLENA